MGYAPSWENPQPSTRTAEEKRQWVGLVEFQHLNKTPQPTYEVAGNEAEMPSLS